MTTNSFNILFIFFLTLFDFTQSKLTLNYYNTTCPKFASILGNIIIDKQMAAPTTAAATLRLLSHDCMVEGCDGSVMIASTPFNSAEHDADINLSLAGDAFDLIVRIKTALELECPGIVSCADILVAATHNLIIMVGGPYYHVRLGRKDGTVSEASNVQQNIATSTMSMSQIIDLFGAKGFTIQEMVALSGAHTIGFSHCKEFASRVFNFSQSSPTDPLLEPTFARGLMKLCANYSQDPEIAAFNDVMTPGKFDNMYYKNLQRGLGLLATDQALATDPRTKPFVDLYAENQRAFFDAFAHAMEKMSVLGVKTGKKGEVRHRCDQFNNMQT